MEHFGGGFFSVEHGTHDVAEGLEEVLVLTDVLQMIVGGTDKDDVVDGGNEFRVEVLGAVFHGNVGLAHRCFLFQHVLHRHQARGAGMSYPKGEPKCSVTI